MPFVHIKHFPNDLSGEQRQELVDRITDALTGVLGCQESKVSIAMETVTPQDWDEQVRLPHLVGQKHLLVKEPS